MKERIDAVFSDREVRGTETAPLFEGGSLFCLVTGRKVQPSSSLRGISSWGQSSAIEQRQQIWFCAHKLPGFTSSVSNELFGLIMDGLYGLIKARF